MAADTAEIIATFREAAAADQAAAGSRLIVGSGAVLVDRTEDRLRSLEAAQRRETAEAGPVLVGFMTRPQARGALVLGTAGTIAGAVAGALLGLVVHLGDWPAINGVIALGVLGAMAGGVVGFVFGGGRQPEREGEGSTNRHPQGDIAIRVNVRGTDQRAAVERHLVESGATDVVLVDPSATSRAEEMR